MDPLLSHVFIMCAKVLSSLLLRAEGEGSITSGPLSGGPLRVNHLFFVEDNLLLLSQFSQMEQIGPYPGNL